MQHKALTHQPGQTPKSRRISLSIAVLLSLCLLSTALIFTSGRQESVSAASSGPTPTPTPQFPMFTLQQQMNGLERMQGNSAGGVAGVYQHYAAPGRGYSLDGMTAEYYDDPWLGGSLVAMETITTGINFDLWCTEDESPVYTSCKLHPALTDGRDYSAHWSGHLIVPETGMYTFTVSAQTVDDAMQMYLDGDLILTSNWNGVGYNIESASLWLEEGAHLITIDYTQAIYYGAKLQPQWSGPGFDTEFIPAERSEGCNSTSDCCLNSACCASNEVGGEINTQSGAHNYAVTDLHIAGIGEDLVFRRTYASSLADEDVAGLGYGWTHNYAIRLGLPPVGPTVYVDGVLGNDHLFCGTDQGVWACKTISYALNYRAESGDTVQVAPGTYTETIALRPGITVQGASGQTSVINGADTLGPLVTASGSDITATAVLSGFKLIDAHNANGDGGAIYVAGASPQIVNNVIVSNTAEFGGGVYLSNSATTLINNVIANNRADAAGSGLYVAGSAPHLLYTTIARNSGGDGSGLYVTGIDTISSVVALTNTILVDHTVGVTITEGSTVTLVATLWGTGSWGNTTDWGGEGTIVTGTRNVWDTPIFSDTNAADYHLQYGSAGVDEGIETSVNFDMDGTPRVYNPYGPPDLGADECDECQSGGSRFLPSPNNLGYKRGLARCVLPDTGVVIGETGSEFGSVMFRTADGTALRLLLSPDGRLEPYPGVRITTGWEGTYPDVTYVITQANQYVYRFDREGRPLQSVDPQGHVISYTHNTLGQLTAVTDVGSGRALQFSYDTAGRLRYVTDPLLARDVQFEYNTSGELAVVTDVRGFAWNYTYTEVASESNVISHLLAEVTDPLGYLVESTGYDDEGRAIYQYNELETVVEIEYGDGYTTYFDALGNAHTDNYSGRGALSSQVGPGGSTVTRSYDDNFNLTSLVDQNGNVMSMDWGVCGCNVERVTDMLGNTTHMTYDDAGHPTSLTDARGNTTLYAYDGNLLITTTDALSGTVVNTYRCNGLSSPKNCIILNCIRSQVPGA